MPRLMDVWIGTSFHAGSLVSGVSAIMWRGAGRTVKGGLSLNDGLVVFVVEVGRVQTSKSGERLVLVFILVLVLFVVLHLGVLVILGTLRLGLFGAVGLVRGLGLGLCARLKR